ncbi:MAG TPA: hypothetical protein VHS03_13930, partial [Gaiellaceae bacterium]|nr:hypothetical protein [Gaiellaceae bacterium]
LTTHAMDEAEHLCDRVGIVDHGRLVACGTPAELMDRSSADDTRFAAASGLDVDALAAHLRLELGTVRETRPGEYVIETVATPALIVLLAEWLRDRGVLLRELRAGTQSLEDVFLRLTSEGRS